LPGGPTPSITYGVVAFALIAAIIVAAISGLPAAWRVRRISIADALGGR
jgi:ABC-type antimicrobial peptide transport system permease subunit